MSKVNKAFYSMPADEFLPGRTMQEAANNFTKQFKGQARCKKRAQQKLISRMAEGDKNRKPVIVDGVLGFYHRPRPKQVSSTPKPRQYGARRAPQRSLAYATA